MGMRTRSTSTSGACFTTMQVAGVPADITRVVTFMLGAS